MKLWILHPQSDVEHSPFSGYDVATGFVICASSEWEARDLADKHGGDESCQGGVMHEGDCDCKCPHPWYDPAVTSCVELVPGCYPGVVMRDFHAG